MVVNTKLLGLFSSLRNAFASEFRAWFQAIPAHLDALRDAFLATIGCCFSAVDAKMPTIISKVNRSGSKPSVSHPSPMMIVESPITLYAPGLPPNTIQNDGDDNDSPTEPLEEPLASLELVYDVATADNNESADDLPSVVHVTERVESSQTLHTIVEEPEHLGPSPAVSFTTEEASNFMTAINGMMESSDEALGCTTSVEEQLGDLVAVEDVEGFNEDTPVAEPASTLRRCAPAGVAADADEDAFYDVQGAAEVQYVANDLPFHDVADVLSAEEYDSDEDEGTSVYSIASIGVSFAQHDAKATSSVASVCGDEPDVRVPDDTSPLQPAWDTELVEQQRLLPSNVQKHGNFSVEDRDVRLSDEEATATAVYSCDIDEAALPSCKQHAESVYPRDDEIRTGVIVEDHSDLDTVDDVCDGVAASEAVEEFENEVLVSRDSTAAVMIPTTDSDAAPCGEHVVDKTTYDFGTSLHVSSPRSYVSDFTGIPTTLVAGGVSYRQLAIELSPKSEDEPSFYRVALQKLKQERQLRRLNPIVMEPVMSPPSSNSSVYGDEDEDERRTRLKKIDELRKRTTGFEVKIGKPLFIGRVPYIKS